MFSKKDIEKARRHNQEIGGGFVGPQTQPHSDESLGDLLMKKVKKMNRGRY